MAENDTTTIIGSDSTFKGELSFNAKAQINGRFEGKVDGKGELIVANGATCAAEVNTSAVQVDGNVEGPINASDKVQLNAKGAVKGDITAAKMTMAEGASFYGMCNVGADASKNAGKPTGNPQPDPRPNQGNQGGGSGSGSNKADKK